MKLLYEHSSGTYRSDEPPLHFTCGRDKVFMSVNGFEGILVGNSAEYDRRTAAIDLFNKLSELDNDSGDDFGEYAESMKNRLYGE